MISLKTLFRNTAALCAILTVGVSLAEDGVVRLSDRSQSQTASGIQRAGFVNTEPCGESCYTPQPCPSHCSAAPCFTGSDPCNTGICYSGGCNNGVGGMCNSGMCNSGMCYTPMDCNSCFAGGDNCDMNGGWGNNRNNYRDGRGRGRGGRNNPCDDGRPRGFVDKCRNANARACDRLFGWMIPSGNCGQGSPWLGKYHMAYADQPSYIDHRDTHLYAAPGYGMPMTVPLAPNVNHAYNYSSGLPGSRVTHIGNYNPLTSPRPLKCQTW